MVHTIIVPRARGSRTNLLNAAPAAALGLDVVPSMEDAKGLARLDEAALARLDATFCRDGIAVLQRVIPAPVLDAIARRLDFDAAHQVYQTARELRGAPAAHGADEETAAVGETSWTATAGQKVRKPPS